MKEYVKIQRKIDKKYKMSVVFRLEHKIKTLGDVIYVCVKKINSETVYKEQPNRQQSYSGAQRSLEDIYRIAKSYIKGVQYKDIVVAIDKLVHHNIVGRGYCSTIHKTVHYENYNLSQTAVNNCLNNHNLNK